MLVMQSTFFDPVMFEAQEHLDFGCNLIQQNHFADAIIEFDITLKLDPKNRYARWNRALALLSLGDYSNGLPEHESAWEIYDWRALGQFKGNVDCILELPVWMGERCKLLVYHEMGFGDAIMLLRFLPEIVKRCETVTLVVRSELVSLMQGYGADVIDYIPQISGFDARVTFFNSVHTMGHSLATIPSSPYIKADFNFNDKFKFMGITWSGNARKELDINSFLSMLERDGYTLQSLQDPMQSYFGVGALTTTDFLDTSKLISGMDCIVTVDTAAAHLAGAMGHPNTHLLLPFFCDWRWWSKSIWYPSINIYRQETAGDWSIPFARLNAALKG